MPSIFVPQEDKSGETASADDIVGAIVPLHTTTSSTIQIDLSGNIMEQLESHPPRVSRKVLSSSC